jgi:DNA helicase II / ATP-dependent DNA helicase PcrA
MSDLLSTLNEAQRAAAQHLHGPALVVAGAGAGKTSTVVRRIAYLMEAHGVYPNEILAVTFTNKAAGDNISQCRGKDFTRLRRVGWLKKRFCDLR